MAPLIHFSTSISIIIIMIIITINAEILNNEKNKSSGIAASATDPATAFLHVVTKKDRYCHCSTVLMEAKMKFQRTNNKFYIIN